MSVIVVVKERDSIVLGTDSRYVTGDKSRVVSDSVEKDSRNRGRNVSGYFWIRAGLQFPER